MDDIIKAILEAIFECIVEVLVAGIRWLFGGPPPSGGP